MDTGTEAIAIRALKDRKTMITVLSPNGKHAFTLNVDADDHRCGTVFVYPGDNRLTVYGAGKASACACLHADRGEAAIRILPIYTTGEDKPE